MLAITPASRPDKKIIQKAAAVLRKGKLIVFPTETLYGLGANAKDLRALRKLLMVKARPQAKGFIVLIGEKDDITTVTREIPAVAKKLMRAFWPGALTIIFYKNRKLSSVLTGGKDTIAVRLDKHPVTRALIKKAGFPVAAPSANFTGTKAPRTIEKPYAVFNQNPHIGLFLDAGEAPLGKPSTIVDVTKTPRKILRAGAITKKALKKVLPDIR